MKPPAGGSPVLVVVEVVVELVVVVLVEVVVVVVVVVELVVVEVAVVVVVVEEMEVVVVELVEVVVVVELVVELLVVLVFFPGSLLRVRLFSWQEARFIPMAGGYTRLLGELQSSVSGSGIRAAPPVAPPWGRHRFSRSKHRSMSTWASTPQAGPGKQRRSAQENGVYSNMICSNGQDVTIATTPCLDV
ncbi:unnamed protein product [Boreogadus saida]